MADFLLDSYSGQSALTAQERAPSQGEELA